MGYGIPVKFINKNQMTIKQEIKSFYSKLRKEIKKRERYVAGKSITWQITGQADAYQAYTQELKNLVQVIFDTTTTKL